MPVYMTPGEYPKTRPARHIIKRVTREFVNNTAKLLRSIATDATRNDWLMVYIIHPLSRFAVVLFIQR